MAETSMRELAVVHDYAQLVAALRQRATKLWISQAALDEIAGLAEGHVSKLLRPKSPVRILGRVSLGAVMGALGVKLILVEDPVALERVQSRLVQKRKTPGAHGAHPREHEHDDTVAAA